MPPAACQHYPLKQVFLLRAATRLALFQEGRQEDDALHQQALEDARSYLAISSETPNVRYFSPKVVELFRAARGGSRP